ncbi:hypothetical protein MTR_1g021030 [Medicago truncatula]|uniref:HAT C-terminal dimerisation domain-containing protein n=1 Tax=Medicago truncatula TaxID=3880 RepID=G7I4H9_MEDTR|nr:hypothetical protein MTR_1g021030 [Medicago truncatula]
MTEFYPNYFIDVPEVALHTQLKNYVKNVRSDPKVCNTFAMVYKLLKLTLLLPIATASVDRVFLANYTLKSRSIFGCFYTRLT